MDQCSCRSFILIVIIMFITPLVLTISTHSTTGETFSAQPLAQAGHRSMVNDAPENLEYAIIAPEAFVNELEPLAQWKTRRGVITEIFTLENIYLEYTGRDYAERIHNFLQALNGSTNLKWLLLVGDSELVPVRSLYAGAAEQDMMDYYPSDYYYAGLSSDWDGDGDSIFGEPGEEDWVADVYVGRLPVNTADETSLAVSKILNYERNPPEGDWYTRAMFCGGLMAAPNAADYDPQTDNAYEVKERAKLYLPLYFSTTFYYDYPKNIGGQYSPSVDNLDHDRVMNTINSGVGIINFATQGYMNANGLGDYYYHPVYGGTQPTFQHLFYYTDAEAVTNGGRLPLIYVSSCDSGNFTERDDTNLERLMTNENGGAIGVICPTGLTYRGETPTGGSYGNWWLDEKFWELFFDGSFSPGQTLYEAKGAYYQEIMLNYPSYIENKKTVMYSYNLLGDPEVPIWTAPPEQLSVTLPPFYSGSHEVVIEVTNATGTPVENARVCIEGAGEFHLGSTDASGRFHKEIAFEQFGNVNVTVSAHNFFTLELAQMVVAEPADLLIDSTGIAIDPLEPEVGETVTITATILNDGGAASVGVPIQFFDGEPSQGMLIGTAEVTALNPSESASVEVEWLAPAGVHDLTVLIDPFAVIQESDELNNLCTVKIIIRAPDLLISPDDIRLESTEKITLGDETAFTISVRNTGLTPAPVFTVSLFENNPAFNPIPLASTATDEPMPPESTKELVIEAAVNTSTFYIVLDPNNEVVEMNETNNMVSFTVPVNSRPNFPTLPTLDFPEDIERENILNLALNCYDSDGDQLNFSLTDTTDPACGVIIHPSGIVDLFPETDWFGNATLTITASDGYTEVTQLLTITITPVNDAPVLHPPFQFDVNEGSTLHATINATDIDRDALTFSTTSTFIAIDKQTGEITLTPGNDAVGAHTIVITVSDGKTTIAETITIRVINVNDPPTIQPLVNASFTATIGLPFSFRINASDPDGDTLHYFDDTELFTIDPTSGLIAFTPTEAQKGQYTVTITVNDATNSTTTTLTFVINDPEAPKGSSSNGKKPTPAVGLGPTLITLVLVLLTIQWLNRRKQAH